MQLNWTKAIDNLFVERYEIRFAFLLQPLTLPEISISTANSELLVKASHPEVVSSSVHKLFVQAMPPAMITQKGSTHFAEGRDSYLWLFEGDLP